MALRIRPGLGLELRARCHSGVHRLDSPRRLDRLGRGGGRARVPPPRCLALTTSASVPPANNIKVAAAAAAVASFATYSRLSSSSAPPSSGPPSNDDDDYHGHDDYDDNRGYRYGPSNLDDLDALQDPTSSDFVSRLIHSEASNSTAAPNAEEHASLPNAHDTAVATDPAELAPKGLSAFDEPLFALQTPTPPSTTLEPDARDSSADVAAKHNGGISELRTAGGMTLEIPDAVRNRLPLPGIVNSVLIRPFEVFPHWRETLRSFRAHYGSWKLQQLLSYRRQEVLGRHVREDWHILLNKFISSTPQRPPGGAWIKLSQWVELPAAAAKVLLENVDDNIWDIYEVTDCHIDAYISESDPNAPVTIFFTGDDTSVEEAWRMMCRTCQSQDHPIHHLNLVPFRKFRNPSVEPGSLDELAPPVMRPIFVKGHDDGGDREGTKDDEATDSSYAARLLTKIGHNKRVSSMYSGGLFAEDKPILISRFEDVPLPTEWTKYTFCRYMNALVQARISPARLKAAYRNALFLHQALQMLLDDVFSHAANNGALSAASFRLGLKLMTRYAMPRRRIDDFFQNIQYGYQMEHVADDARVWNLLLEPVIRTHNIDQFTGIVEAMGSHLAAPDRRTWQLFIQLVEHPTAKHAIIRAMQSKGLLSEHKAMRIVTNELSMHHALEVCRAGQPLRSFMKMQAQRLGPAWLTQHSLGTTIEAFCRYGRFDDCMTLLKFAYDDRNRQRVYVIPMNWNIIVYHARLQDNAHALANAVAAAEALEPAYITAVFYENMLRLAWDARRPILMSEAWLAACITGKITAAIGVRMSVIFSWLIARMAGDPDALPYKLSPNFPKISSRRRPHARSRNWGPILLPPVIVRIAQHVWKTRITTTPPPPTLPSTDGSPPEDTPPEDAPQDMWWRDKPALLAVCINATRDLFPHEVYPFIHGIGVRLQDAARRDDAILKEWNADRLPETAQRLDITPLGPFWYQQQDPETRTPTTMTPENVEAVEEESDDVLLSDSEEAAIEAEFQRKFEKHMNSSSS